jgi:hypothetical protein
LEVAVEVVVVAEDVGVLNRNEGLPRSKLKLADVTGVLVVTSAVAVATTPNFKFDLTDVAAALNERN